MKKITTLTFSWLVTLASQLVAQIPNAGFENWTSVGSYQIPDGWGTMNHATATTSVFTAVKGTPGSPGNSYLKLTSLQAGAAVVNGVAVSGKLDTLTQEPISGFAFNQRPATFGGRWQHMIYGSSQGSVKVLLTRWNTSFSQRDIVASASVTLSGMAMSWANFTMPLVYADSLHYPDSCIIVLKASGSAPTISDYLWADNLAFTGTVALAPPPNPVGISKNENAAVSFDLFPNPAKHTVTLNLNAPSTSPLRVQVIDITGKLVQEMTLTPTISGAFTQQVDISKLEKGLYTVLIKSNSSSGSHKLLVE